MASEDFGTPIAPWQQQADEFFQQGDYIQAAGLYEQAIATEPDVKSHYWHLGLMLLLQGQEAEAQMTWLYPMTEGTPEQVEQWTAELLQVLQGEAERREAIARSALPLAIAEYSVAMAIRQHIREIEPENINNLLHIIQLSVYLEIFSGEDIASLGIVELLNSEKSNVNVKLLLTTLQNLLEYAPYDLSVLRLIETCRSYRDAEQHLTDMLIATLKKITKPYRDRLLELGNEPDNVTRFKHSHLDEETVIDHYLNKLDVQYKCCVDIAAGDGLLMSNTYFLFERGWSGLAVECNGIYFARLSQAYVKFPQVHLSKCMVTPDNVVNLLKAHEVPVNFGFLSLDIDGYDYFVLDSLLSAYRPCLLCVEINEKIPPPLKFTVKWDADYLWNQDHFYGQSICQLDLLAKKHKYALVELHYNNAFLIPQEITPVPSLTPEEAYEKGYLNKPDRKEKFPWNEVMEEIHTLSPQEALNYINNICQQYQGKFICSL